MEEEEEEEEEAHMFWTILRQGVGTTADHG